MTTDARTKAILVAAVVAGAVITNSLAKIFETLYGRRPEIIQAKGEKKEKIITAKSEAEALIIRTQARAHILAAGLEAGKAAPAAEMLRMQSLDADLPEGRRLKDDPLAKLLAIPKVRGGGTARPDSDGGPQDGEPDANRAQSVVRKMRVARPDPPGSQAKDSPLDPGNDGRSSLPSG